MHAQRFAIRHILASVGSIVILTGLSPCFYFLLVLATGDVGGPLNLCIIPCANCITAAGVTLILFMPISAILEQLLKRLRAKWQTLFLSPGMATGLFIINLALVLAGFMLLVGIVLAGDLAPHIISDHEREAILVGLVLILFLGGVPLLLGTTLYWFLLRIADALLTAANRPRS
ncbi:MAG: hypothetical protein KKA73_25450 [Chloroflexi bacterium]|nr:hypothetical protein [Chloroflexota bacterium]MBU1751043.1 hypothetical protein [Chloroflexota bacterium]